MHLVTKYLPSSRRPNTSPALHCLYWLFYVSPVSQLARVTGTSAEGDSDFLQSVQAGKSTRDVLVLASDLLPGCCNHCRQSCIQISKCLFFFPPLQRTEPQLHLSLLHPPRASFSQEQRLTPLVGWSKLGGKGEVQKLCFQKMLFSAQLHGEKGRNDRLSDTRGREIGKENVASKKGVLGSATSLWRAAILHKKCKSLFFQSVKSWISITLAGNLHANSRSLY